MCVDHLPFGAPTNVSGESGNGFGSRREPGDQRDGAATSAGCLWSLDADRVEDGGDLGASRRRRLRVLSREDDDDRAVDI